MASDYECPRGRPHLLFLCQSLPYPVDSGAHVRSYHTLRLLSSAFDLTAFFFWRRTFRHDSAAVARGLEGMRELARAQAFPIPQEWSLKRRLWDHIRSIVHGRAYTAFAYSSRQVNHALDSAQKGRSIDLVHLDSLDLIGYADRFWHGPPIVCSHHNVESRLLRQRSEGEPGRIRGSYLKFQAGLVEQQERQWLPRIALNLVVSEIDRAHFSATAPGAQFFVLPNCVDTAFLRPRPRAERKGLVFVGPHRWQPNRDGMHFFCTEVLPRVRAEDPGCPVTWLAHADPGTCRRLSRAYGIRVLGYMEDIRPVVNGAACYIVPLHVGSGTRVKIVEAWALGCAVVSTSVGAEGLHAIAGRNILLADDPWAMAKAILRVIRQPKLRERLGAEGRATAVARYDWDTQREPLVASYMQLLPG